MASNVSAICCASYEREPLKSRCSMKWETPARSSRSSREPAPIQKPIETERTLGTFSEITRSPESSSDRTYFCTRRMLRDESQPGARPLRHVQHLVGEAEQRLRVVRVRRTGRDAEARAHADDPLVGARLERVPHAADDLARRFIGGLRQQKREFVP